MITIIEASEAPALPGSADISLEAVTARGERVTHLISDNCYYAHLSIYSFASQYCQDAVVLDAGCGSGYGSAYLADHGARAVWGVDISATAIEFSRRHFQRPNLEFQVLDLGRIGGFSDRSFDLIFSSNALEHVADVSAFLRAAWRLLKPDGALVVAVPPITSSHGRTLNIQNPYHLNIWSPRQWHHALSRYFATIKSYGHGFEALGQVLDFGRTPEQTGIDERNFVIEPVPVEQLADGPAPSAIPTITAIFVARAPHAEAEIPAEGSSLTFVDDSFSSAPADKAFQLQLQERIGTLDGALQEAARCIQALEGTAREAARRIQALEATARATDRYIGMLEEAVREKNRHIARLEELIQRIESGHVMRLLRRLKVSKGA